MSVRALLSLFLLPLVCVGEVKVLRGPWANRTIYAPSFRVAGPQVFSVSGRTVDLMPYLLSLDPSLCPLEGAPRPNVSRAQINGTLTLLASGRIGIAVATLECRDTALRLCQNTPGCPGLLFLHPTEAFVPPVLNHWGKVWSVYFPFNATPRVPSVYALFPMKLIPTGPNTTFFLPEVIITDQLSGFQMTAESYGVFLQVFDALLLAVTAALAAFVAIQSIRRKLAVGIVVGCVEFSLTAVRFAVLCVSWNSIHTTYSMCVNSIWLLLFVSPSMCCTLLVAVFWFYAALFPLRNIAWRALLIPFVIASLVLIAAEFVRPICECTISFAGFPPAPLRLTGIILIIIFYGLSTIFFLVSALVLWRRLQKTRVLKTRRKSGLSNTWVLVACMVVCQIGCIIFFGLIAAELPGEFNQGYFWAGQTLLPWFVIGASFFQLLLFWDACSSDAGSRTPSDSTSLSDSSLTDAPLTTESRTSSDL